MSESQAAVGAPVEPSVRPCAWTARSWLASRSGGHFVPERRHAFDVPLYDQAALDAALRAEASAWGSIAANLGHRIELGREIVEQLLACHDEPTCPALKVAREWLAGPNAELTGRPPT